MVLESFKLLAVSSVPGTAVARPQHGRSTAFSVHAICVTR